MFGQDKKLGLKNYNLTCGSCGSHLLLPAACSTHTPSIIGLDLQDITDGPILGDEEGSESVAIPTTARTNGSNYLCEVSSKTSDE